MASTPDDIYTTLEHSGLKVPPPPPTSQRTISSSRGTCIFMFACFLWGILHVLVTRFLTVTEKKIFVDGRRQHDSSSTAAVKKKLLKWAGSSNCHCPSTHIFCLKLRNCKKKKHYVVSTSMIVHNIFSTANDALRKLKFSVMQRVEIVDASC